MNRKDRQFIASELMVVAKDLVGGAERDYLFLGRMQQDFDYTLNERTPAYGHEKHLMMLDFDKQLREMKKLWNRVDEKPEWLTKRDIADYEKKIKKLKRSKSAKDLTSAFIWPKSTLSDVFVSHLVKELKKHNMGHIHGEGDYLYSNNKKLFPVKNQSIDKIIARLKTMRNASKIASLPPEIEKLQNPFSKSVNKILDGIDEYKKVMSNLGRMRDYPSAERIGKRGEATARKMSETWNAIMDDFFILRQEMDDWRGRVSADIDPMIERIERYTDRNNHNDAMLYFVSKILRHPAMTKRMKEISRESAEAGYTPHGLIQERRKMLDKALGMAKKRFNEDIYNRLYMAF